MTPLAQQASTSYDTWLVTALTMCPGMLGHGSFATVLSRVPLIDAPVLPVSN